MVKSNRSVRARVALGGCVAAGFLFARASSSNATVVYSNLTNFSGYGESNGSATLVGSTNYTPMNADDIAPITGYAGTTVSEISFTLSNFNDADQSVDTDLRFYASDGAGGGPGTLLDAIDLGPETVGTGEIDTYTIDPAAADSFAIPSGYFWAGITFDDGGGTGITTAELANMGQGIFDPPTIGTSQDAFFATSTGGSFASSNPAGGFQYFGGNPVASFGWEFSVASVPEPASIGIVGVMAAGLLARRRSRRAI